MTYDEAIRYYRLAESHLDNPIFDTSREHSENIWPPRGDWLLRDLDGRQIASVAHVERVPFAVNVTTEHDGEQYSVGMKEDGSVIHVGKVFMAHPDELRKRKPK